MSCVSTVGIGTVVAALKVVPAELVVTIEVGGTTVLVGLVDSVGEVETVLTGTPPFFSAPLAPPETGGGEYCTAVCTPNENAALAFTSGVGGANPGKGNNVTIISNNKKSLINTPLPEGREHWGINITRKHNKRIDFFDIPQLLNRPPNEVLLRFEECYVGRCAVFLLSFYPSIYDSLMIFF